VRSGCIWVSIALIVLFLLVVGVILPRSILHRKEHRRPTPSASVSR